MQIDAISTMAGRPQAQAKAAPPDLNALDIIDALRGTAYGDFALAQCIRACQASGDLDAMEAFEAAEKLARAARRVAA